MWLVAVTLTVFAFLCTNKRYRWFYIIYKTFRRDIRAFLRFSRLKRSMALYEKQNQTIAKVFRKLVEKHPDKVAFYFEDLTWTYKQSDEFSDKVATYFKNQGFKRGDTIALYLESRPEYALIWLGLSKIGVVTALINTNLVNEPLMHSLNAAKAKTIIFGSAYSQVIKNVFDKLKDTNLYQFHENEESGDKSLVEGSIDLRAELKGVSSQILSKDIDSLGPKDPLIYIYTSGTTGLPKAAVITNLRFMFMATAINSLTDLNTDDILYDSLPFYHSAGGVIGVGQTFIWGVSVVVKKKFSASNFWKDCQKYKCTAAQYIGEICRYLLATSEKNDDVIKHSVKKVIGNGLRPQIWEKFVKRFGLEEVYEIYGATEGISNLINIDSTIGAVGFVPRYARPFYPVCLIKCDQITGEPIRNEQGLCTACKPDEAGVFVGKVNRNDRIFAFAGYANNEKENNKKIIKDVLKKGDMFFNSGDVLEYDEFGYYYFKDRTGDTFRWKGENVSTAEVEAVISNIVELKDVLVYGVQVPHTEGRIGMAAIVDTDKTLNLDALAKCLKSNLPAYAMPAFLRVLASVPMTGTYKLKKYELLEAGYNPNHIKDGLYVYNRKDEKYGALTPEVYNDILDRRIVF